MTASQIESHNDIISCMKAVAIMAMVLGHACVHTPVDSVVNLFHMPLFFFVSGYCFKEKYLNDARTFLQRKLKGIYWPYLKWSIFFLLLHNVFCYLHIHNINDAWTGYYTLTEYKGRLFNIVTRMQAQDYPLLGGYWFLKTLLWTNILAYLWLRLTRRWRYNDLIGIGVALMLTIVDDITQYSVSFFNIQSHEYAAIALFLAGHAFRQYNLRPLSICECVIVLCIFVAGYFYWSTAMFLPFFDNTIIVPYLISAVLVIWLIYSAFYKLQRISILHASWGG